jgi:macrolide-specific efflux system membrane fusion protein
MAAVKKKRQIGRYVTIAIVLALVALLIKACAFPGKPPTRYITAPVKIGDIEQTVLADGVLQPLQLVDVGAQASGQVKSLKVALGDHVTEGQLIAVIDPSTEQNALLNAQAILEQQQAQHRLQAATVAQNQRLYDRQLETYAGSASSKQDLETAQTNLETAKASLAAIEAQIKQAKLTVDTAAVNLGFTQIHAPISGVVVSVVTKEGQTVNAVQSAPSIVQLAKLDTMTVKAQISEADVIKVHPGQSVYFTILGDPNRRYYATLRAVAPAPDAPATPSATPAAIYYSGLFDVANADGRLRPSMTTQVNVVLAGAKHVLIAPAAALGPAAKDGAPTVRVLDPKTKKPAVREVRTGINNLVDVQILSGLKAGENVIIAESTGAFAAPKPPSGG